MNVASTRALWLALIMICSALVGLVASLLDMSDGTLLADAIVTGIKAGAGAVVFLIAVFCFATAGSGPPRA
ncbi:hypothetical protein [Actinoplanes sp. NPDC049681]|uniref:hypothetical protein n=1 Tax=Actinoplanes sp. NPDC049681 TaxID=3363905 RepID=UPI0037BBC68F